VIQSQDIPNEVKTSMDGLRVGMYVTRLDRPWLETPFPLQGVKIKSAEDIDLLRRYANYVYVDIERGHAPENRFWILEGQLALQDEVPAPVQPQFRETTNEYTKLKKCFYRISTTVEQEMDSARQITGQLDNNIKRLYGDLEKGHHLDISLVKEGVAALVDSVTRNPSAFSLLMQMQKSDEYTYNHSLGTSVWCAQFGRHLGLEKDDIRELALGGMLLDVGKVRLPQTLLSKKEAISPAEAMQIQQHVDHSLRILAQTGAVSPRVMKMVATHHERADGNGYPEGLPNDQIPIFGRIAGIVDSYDAMTSKKPYTEQIYSPVEAIDELYKCRGSSFQEELVEQFIQTIGIYPTGSLIEFVDGSVGVVLEVNDLKRLFPVVMILLDEKKVPLENFLKIDLSREDSEYKIKNALPYGAYGIKMDELFL